jgi:hypothetical protein
MTRGEGPTIFGRLLHGIEAGIIGGLAMIVLLASGAMLRGYGWWQPSNLLGSTFYGARAFRAGLGRATLSGLALHLVITGVVGGAFAILSARIRTSRRLVLLGALAGIAWFYLADAILWRWANPWVPLYSARLDALLAHALYGACLGNMARQAPPDIDVPRHITVPPGVGDAPAMPYHDRFSQDVAFAEPPPLPPEAEPADLAREFKSLPPQMPDPRAFDDEVK